MGSYVTLSLADLLGLVALLGVTRRLLFRPAALCAQVPASPRQLTRPAKGFDLLRLIVEHLADQLAPSWAQLPYGRSSGSALNNESSCQQAATNPAEL